MRKAKASDTVQVYSTEDFKLLDKKSLKLPGVKEFKWSPTQNIIAAYIPGQDAGQNPARIVLIDIPSRKEIRQKNLFSVSEIALFWHPDGTYLAVKVASLLSPTYPPSPSPPLLGLLVSPRPPPLALFPDPS